LVDSFVQQKTWETEASNSLPAPTGSLDSTLRAKTNLSSVTGESAEAAMQLVRDWGGTVIAVGKRALVPGCQIVANPTELAYNIRILDGLRGVTGK
jgi:hypothetical protein